MRYDAQRKDRKLPQVRITPAMDDAIRAACTDLQRPIAWVVTDALRSWLDEYQGAPELTRARSERSS